MDPIFVPFIVQAACQIGIRAALCLGSPQVQRAPSLPELVSMPIVNQYQYSYYGYMFSESESD